MYLGRYGHLNISQLPSYPIISHHSWFIQSLPPYTNHPHSLVPKMCKFPTSTMASSAPLIRGIPRRQRQSNSDVPSGKRTLAIKSRHFMVELPSKRGDVPWLFYKFTREYQEIHLSTRAAKRQEVLLPQLLQFVTGSARVPVGGFSELVPWRWKDGVQLGAMGNSMGYLVGGLEHFLFSHILGIIIPID